MDTTYLLLVQTRAESIPNPEQFGKVADKFLVQSLSSDVSFLYPPSQVLPRCVHECTSLFPAILS